jgi:hypothetical protein
MSNTGSRKHANLVATRFIRSRPLQTEGRFSKVLHQFRFDKARPAPTDLPSHFSSLQPARAGSRPAIPLGCVAVTQCAEVLGALKW